MLRGTVSSAGIGSLLCGIGLLWCSGFLVAQDSPPSSPANRVTASRVTADEAQARARRYVSAQQPVYPHGILALITVLAVTTVVAMVLLARVRRLERATRRSEEGFALAIAGANDGIWDWDLAADRMYVSPRLQEILAYRAEGGYVGRPLAVIGERLYPDERLPVLARIEDHFGGLGEELFEIEFRWQVAPEQYRWVLMRGKALRDARGKVMRMSGSITDIDQRKRQEQALMHQTLHDALTDLPNRTLLQDRVDQAIRAGARASRSFALLSLDIDHFQEINDTLGRAIGDEVLKEVSVRLLRTLRTSDTVARLGGDEFGLLLPEIAGEVYASHVAKKIALALNRTFDLEQHALHIGASIGIALYPQHGEDADTLFRHANTALYRAKRSGAGSAIYDPGQDQSSVRRLALANDLHEALAHDALSVHFQPIVDLRAGSVIGVETLLRWQHPPQGPIRPDEIIPLAERSDLIKPLTLWVLDAALQQQADWERQGWSLGVSVNLSVRSLQEPKLIQQIDEALAHWKVPPTKLELEITESAMMSDPRRSLEILTQLSEMGVHLAVDDYGTGFSSLAYLKRLPVDAIKIDKSFVMTMDRDEDDAAIVRSTVELAHLLGLTVVAEGVESQAISDGLAALGCDAAQGYHYCRPCSADVLGRWLGESRWGETMFTKLSKR